MSKFDVIAAAVKARAHTSTMPNTVTLQRQTSVEVNDKRPSEQEKEWWLSKTARQQNQYLKQHPKSKKLQHLKNMKVKTEEKLTTPRQTGDDVPDQIKPHDPTSAEGHAKIIWPGQDQNIDTKERQEHRAKRQQEADLAWKINRQAEAANKKNAPFSTPTSLAFMLRHGRFTLSKDEKKKMTEEEKEQHAKELEHWNQFSKMDLDELDDAAGQHYLKNPDEAKEDNVHVDPDLQEQYENTYPHEDEDEEYQAKETNKEDAEDNPTAKNPEVTRTFNKAYNAGVLKNQPKNVQDKFISRAISGLQENFSAAHPNEIISNAYKCLNHQQIIQLDQLAQEALGKQVAEKSVNQLGNGKKKLLKTLFVIVAVAAAVATGGAGLGLIALHHSMQISGADGRTHSIIWNALRGKNADGSDDPHFDQHDDAVEKIIKSLRRQLRDTDDENEHEHINEMIDALETQLEYHREDNTDTYTKPKRKKSKRH